MPTNTPIDVEVDGGRFAIVGAATGTNAFGGGGVGVTGIGRGTGQGVHATAETSGTGVTGISDSGTGVAGMSTHGDGVTGLSDDKNGVSGSSLSGVGVFGSASGHEGVRGEGSSATFSAVAGIQLNPDGTGAGVWGESHGQGDGAHFESSAGRGVSAVSQNQEGMHGESNSETWAGVTGLATNRAGTAPGMWAESQGKGPGIVAVGVIAGQFRGDIDVRGNISCQGDLFLTNADCAEDFDGADTEGIVPGTVMVLTANGHVRCSTQAYDRRVAGVVAGAGTLKPGIILGRESGRPDRVALSLVGRVYCKVDAQYSSIAAGDWLTTSPTPGHAMKASNWVRAFGSVIGKAMQPLEHGSGLIQILVSLR